MTEEAYHYPVVRASRRLTVSSTPHASASRLQHHFADGEQQFDSAVLGTWIFLVTEIMFFGGMFMAYILYRSWYPEAFIAGSHHLDITLGAFNTAVLIGSSYTVVLACERHSRGEQQRLLRWLLATIGLGSCFSSSRLSSTTQNGFITSSPARTSTGTGPETRVTWSCSSPSTSR